MKHCGGGGYGGGRGGGGDERGRENPGEVGSAPRQVSEKKYSYLEMIYSSFALFSGKEGAGKV